MKKIILVLISFSSFCTFALGNEICGKVESLTISYDKLTIKLNSSDQAYIL